MLYGRGAADMKGAIACFVAAVARLTGAGGTKPAGSISLLITGDEEGPGINGTRKMLEWLDAEGQLPDACLVGEPTNPLRLGEMVKIGRRGSLYASLTVTGKAGHTAYPQQADNPIPRLLAMLGAITAEKLDQGTEHFQPSTLEISSIDVGNAALNVIPAKANARFNVRFNDMHQAADVESWARRHFDRVGGAYDLEVEVSGEAFLTPPGPLSEAISGAVGKVTGALPELSTSGGTSDARFIKDYCPVAEFGLVGQTMHGTDERVALTDLARLSDIYLVVLEAYFGAS
jgi:succinyl-diaminopimelate desuccinylase